MKSSSSVFLNHRDASRLGSCIPKLFSEIRVKFRVGTSFSRVETSSEGSDITVPTSSDPNFREFSRIFVKIRVGHYRNISEIRKKSISETRKNENFGKKCLTQGLSPGTGTWKPFYRDLKDF